MEEAPPDSNDPALEQENDQQLQEDNDVEEQVNKFFAELDIDQERQKKRFLKGDMRVS